MKCTGRIPQCTADRLFNGYSRLANDSSSLNHSDLVTRIRQWLAISILLATTLLNSHGQTLPDWLVKHPSGTPPRLGVLDDARFLARDPHVIDRINSEIVKLHEDHGFRIHLVILSTLIGTTPQDQADQLWRIWLPRENGLVIVFESDTRTFGFGQGKDGNPLNDRNPKQIPTFEIRSILNRALIPADQKLSTEDYFQAVVGNIVSSLNGYFVSRRQAPSSQRSVRIALLFIGGASLLGLGAIGAGALVRYSRLTHARGFQFPPTEVRERLGAPCGASVTSRRFAPPTLAPPG